MRIAGLDIGRKRIGVAISDPMAIVAQGTKTIDVKDIDDSLAKIDDFIKENTVDEIVVGMPLNMNGSESAMTKEVIQFVDRLKARVGIPVRMWDERLTSLSIEKDLIFLDVSRAKRKKINDMLAAQIILQGYLDSRKNV
jgi:putative Holliday junction resolvase